MRVPASRLREFGAAVLAKAGMSPVDAEISAEAMVWADLRGRFAHGITSKLPQCVSRIAAGGTQAVPDLRVRADAGSLVVMEGDRAWGQVAGSRAIDLAVERAAASGMALVTVSDVSSAAAMGYFPSRAAARGMIGISITNGPSLLAPHGGSTRVLGNQAHAMACPAGDRPPIVYDAATSVMSTGAIELVHERGGLLPDGVLLDGQGVPTVDPSLWKSGMLAPAGGHRGYGLSLMFEVLTGALAGGDVLAPDVGHPFVYEVPQGVSLTAMAIDPGVVMPAESFVARVDDMIERLHASPPSRRGDRVYYPGERSGLAALDRERTGIPVPEERVDALREVGRRVGIAW